MGDVIFERSTEWRKRYILMKNQYVLNQLRHYQKGIRHNFRRDYFADLLKIAKVFGSGAKKRADLRTISFDDLNHFDMDVLYDIVWTMAKSADRTIPDPMEWLDGFETFPLKELLPEIKDLLENSMPQSKKK